MGIPFGIKPLEFDQYISPDGQTYKFNNAIDQFLLAGVSGTGMPPITYRTQRGPFQHGVTPLGFILEPRIVNLLHRRNTDCREDYWAARADIMNQLRPNRQDTNDLQLGVLRKIHQPDRTKRDLSVFVQAGPQFVATQQRRWDEFGFTEAIQFIAHDPTFFDPAQKSQDMVIDGISPNNLIFSFVFPFSFSGTTGASDTITYEGTWETFPEITIVGPILNPIIRNVTTDSVLELDHEILAGTTITIDLTFGNKTIVDDVGQNLIGILTPESDLATFSLVPDPLAPSGVNSIGVSGSDTTAATQVVFRWFDRYIGL